MRAGEDMGLAAIDVDLVHFMQANCKLECNGGCNLAQYIVCHTVQLISVHVCVQPCLHLMRFNKFVNVKLLYFCIPGL